MRWFSLLLLCSLDVFAQNSPVSDVSRNVQANYSLNPGLKVHLFFNQPMYMPGDTAFFRVALLTAAELLPIKGSQIMEIDILSEKGEVLHHQEFRVRDGWAENQLIIPSYWTPGIYRVIAYTQWMRNFSSSLFFETTLSLSGKFLFQKSVNTDAFLELFPEGGNLIAGVRNKIMLRSSLKLEKGEVVNHQGERITQFTTDSLGYGYFFLTPLVDQVYEIKIGDQRQVLGPALTEGVNLHYLKPGTSGGSHRFIFQAPKNSYLRKEKLHFIISAHGEVSFSSFFQFNTHEFIALAVPSEALSVGTSVCYLVTESSKVLTTRLIYNSPEPIAVKFILPADTFTTREAVSVKIEVNKQNKAPIQSRLSVSIYKKSLFEEGIKPPTLDQYLLAVSDLGISPLIIDKSLVQSNGNFFDWCLITEKWPWYDIESLHKPQKPAYSFKRFPEIRGLIIDSLNNTPIGDSAILTLFFQRALDLYEMTTSSNGNFIAAPLLDFPERDDMLFIVERKGQRINTAKLVLEQSPISHGACRLFEMSGNESSFYKYSLTRELVRQSYQYYNRSFKNSIEERHSLNDKIEAELLGADVSFTLSDYLIFPTMQETLHEIIPYLQYRKIKGNDVVRMYLPDMSQTGDGSPLFFIDGVPTFSVDYFLNLRPSEVNKVKIIFSQHKRSKLGALGKNGIVLVETKISENEYNIPRGSSVPVHGLTDPLDCVIGERFWQKANSTCPRISPTLFWAPHIRTNETGQSSFNFSTSDDTGAYTIVIEGLTDEGVPFSAEKVFFVRYNPRH